MPSFSIYFGNALEVHDLKVSLQLKGKIMMTKIISFFDENA